MAPTVYSLREQFREKEEKADRRWREQVQQFEDSSEAESDGESKRKAMERARRATGSRVAKGATFVASTAGSFRS